MDRHKNSSKVEIREKIERRKDAEFSARRTLAKECGSATSLDAFVGDNKMSEHAADRYLYALDKGYETLYVTVAEYSAVLRYLRQRKGMSLDELSAAIQVPKPALEQFETAYSVPEPKTREKLEQTLGLSEQFQNVCITDDTRNNIYGIRNYGPFVYDLAYAGQSNVSLLMASLRMTKYFLISTILLAILTMIFAVCFTIPEMEYAKYLVIVFGTLCTSSAILAYIAHRSTMRKQGRVRKAYFNVVNSLYDSKKNKKDDKKKTG